VGREAIQRLAEGHAQADVARSYNVSQATISARAQPFRRRKRRRGMKRKCRVVTPRGAYCTATLDQAKARFRDSWDRVSAK
jgi:hypothetical protein